MKEEHFLKIQEFCLGSTSCEYNSELDHNGKRIIKILLKGDTMDMELSYYKTFDSGDLYNRGISLRIFKINNNGVRYNEHIINAVYYRKRSIDLIHVFQKAYIRMMDNSLDRLLL
jgi:hypothetical protein